MTLDQLISPFERRRAFEYGKGSNKVVRHWYEVQNVIGSLYKSRDIMNQHGDLEYNLFIFFPGTDTGLLYQHMLHPGSYTVEQMAEFLRRACVDSPFHMLCDLDERMTKDQHIGNAEIEFVRQFDPLAADKYAKYREERYARREAEEREANRMREAQRKTEEEAEKAKQQADLAAAKAKYFGWADRMTPMKFGRVRNKMESLIRFEGKVMPLREYIISLLKDGWVPEKKEGVTTWYGSKWNPKQSKPKTVYRLSRDNLCYEVSKTEFDFAVYLAEHKELDY